MESELLEIINTVLKNKNRKPIESLLPEAHLRNDIGFDSLDLAELTVRIEAQFDVDIFAEGMVNTVSEIIEKISK